MGCGVSQSSLHSGNDHLKSASFWKFCSSKKIPLALELNGYFQGLMAECLYKSQGNEDGYHRLLRKRPREITVSKGRRLPAWQVLCRKPLTADGVTDIMNLFLGHVIATLEQRKWSGEFSYTLTKSASRKVETLEQYCAPNAGNLPPSKPSLPPNVSTTPQGTRHGSPNASLFATPPAANKVSTNVLAPPAASLPGAPGVSPINPGYSRRDAATKSLGTTAKASQETELWIDRGDGTKEGGTFSSTWRIDLTGHITYRTVDGALTLICDCAVTFFVSTTE